MRKTGLFLVVLIFAVTIVTLGWEAYSLLDPDDDVAPITTVVAEWNAATGGFVGFVFGTIFGALGAHFFWPRDKRRIR